VRSGTHTRRAWMAMAAAIAAPTRPLAPDFQATDAHGRRRRLSDFRGKVVALNFWATWCGPCRREIPMLRRVHHDYAARGFAVVGVAMDAKGWAAVTPYLAQHAVDYPVLLGDAAIARRYGGLKTLPRTLFLDRAGREVARYDAALEERATRRVVEALLAES